jgi:broad specificity phosphatase PhoE
MEAPAITRRRRPFLAPILLPALATLVVFVALLFVYQSLQTTTVALVRDADYVVGTIADPPLSLQGEMRSQQLARMLGEDSGAGRVDAVYVSEGRRAQQTAAPLLDRLRLSPVSIPADGTGVASRVLREHRGGTVLVIAQRESLARLVNDLSGIDIGPIAEDEFDNLYVVSVPVLGDASLLRLKY